MGNDQAVAGGILTVLLLVIGVIAGSTDPTGNTQPENVSLTQPENSTLLDRVNSTFIGEERYLSLKKTLWFTKGETTPNFYQFVGDGKFDKVIINAGRYENDGSITELASTGEIDVIRAALLAVNSEIELYADLLSSVGVTAPDITTAGNRAAIITNILSFQSTFGDRYDGIIDDMEGYTGTSTNRMHFLSEASISVEPITPYYGWIYYKLVAFTTCDRLAVGLYDAHSYIELEWKLALNFVRNSSNSDTYQIWFIAETNAFPNIQTQLAFLEEQFNAYGTEYYDRMESVGIWWYNSMSSADKSAWINWVTTPEPPEPPVIPPPVQITTVIFMNTTGGTIYPSGTHTYNIDGSTITVTAYPAGPLYTFSHWLIDQQSVDDNPNPYQLLFLVPGSTHTVQAVYTYTPPDTPTPADWTLVVFDSLGGTTDPVPDVYVETGVSKVVTAEPAEGYRFSYWIIDSETQSEVNPYTFNSGFNETHTLEPFFTLDVQGEQSVVVIIPEGTPVLFGDNTLDEIRGQIGDDQEVDIEDIRNILGEI